jgi:hypothetical protein
MCEGCDGSGVRCPATPSCLLPGVEAAGWTIVERCDTCMKYSDDLSAAATRFAEIRWVRCASGGDHAVGRHGVEARLQQTERRARRVPSLDWTGDRTVTQGRNRTALTPGVATLR